MSEIILPLHLFSLLFVAWNIVRADHKGFLWIRGKVETLSPAEISPLHRNTWIGLVGMIVTGILLFLPMKDYLLTRPQFYAKMAFVLTLIINGFVIGKLQYVAETSAYSALSLRQKLPLFISGAISTLCWFGAATMAFFLVEDF